MRRWREAGTTAEDAFTAGALGVLDSLYGMALRLTRNADTAEDLVQDTYEKAFRARARFADGSNLKAWLLTILHNTWRNQQRDRARGRVQFDSSLVDDVTAALETGQGHGADQRTPETLLLDQTLTCELQAALDGLPAAYRDVVWLRDVEGLSYQELATVLDVPVGTVMSRLSRGRRHLYEALAPATGAYGPEELVRTSKGSDTARR